MLISLSIGLISTVLLNVLWILRTGALAHWSYIVGTAAYPMYAGENTDFTGLLVAGGLFCFITVGTLIPSFIFPRLGCLATIMTIPPQIHMVVLLHRHVRPRIENENVQKSVQIYTIITLATTAWSIFSVFRYLSGP